MASDIRTDTRRARQANDLRKVSQDVRAAVSQRHVKAFAITPVGDMKSLGPAIINLQLFDIDKMSFEFGTFYDYADDYAEWREEELGEPLLYTDDDLSDRIFDIWTDLVFDSLVT